MTASEALQEMREQVHRNTDNCDMTISKDCYKAIVSALEKQIPKKAKGFVGRCEVHMKNQRSDNNVG